MSSRSTDVIVKVCIVCLVLFAQQIRIYSNSHVTCLFALYAGVIAICACMASVTDTHTHTLHASHSTQSHTLFQPHTDLRMKHAWEQDKKKRTDGKASVYTKPSGSGEIHEYHATSKSRQKKIDKNKIECITIQNKYVQTESDDADSCTRTYTTITTKE